jgi:hydrogenase expression/formation protein HypC
MCLGVPGKIIEIKGTVAGVDVIGVKKRANITLTPHANIGDYVIIHAGFAIEVLDTEKAAQTLSLLAGFVRQK